MEFGGQPLILLFEQVADQCQAGGASRHEYVQDKLKKRLIESHSPILGQNSGVMNSPGRTNRFGTSQNAAWDYGTVASPLLRELRLAAAGEGYLAVVPCVATHRHCPF